MSARAELAIDLFSDEAVRDPYPAYQSIRDCAPAVWLSQYEVWALGRYADVRAALKADELLISGRGVFLNPLMNGRPGRSSLTSDGDLHRERRKAVIKPMTPSALKAIGSQIDELADALVVNLLSRESFDGIADFSRHLPVALISHLLGLPEEGRERMLDWGEAAFNVIGPPNARAMAAGEAMGDMVRYVTSLDRSQLAPGGWAARLFEAADEGAIQPTDLPNLLVDYVGPSLDTTIHATGHLLHLLGSHPAEYARLLASPELIPSAVNEALRVGSPVKAFTRFALKPYEADEVSIPEGERVLILYGAANHDERHYTDPSRFDIGRDSRDHLALGHGAHRCAGGYLAQLEMEALLRALVARVRKIEVGEPTMLMSNMIHGYATFDASFS